MLVSTRAATDVQFLARPAAGSRRERWRRAFAGALAGRGPVEVREPVAAQLRRLARGASVDLYRPTNRPQFQLVADTDPASVGECLWQRDLELAGHLRHGAIVTLIKDCVKDFTLTSWSFRATREDPLTPAA